jgi:hypothetical protein
MGTGGGAGAMSLTDKTPTWANSAHAKEIEIVANRRRDFIRAVRGRRPVSATGRVTARTGMPSGTPALLIGCILFGLGLGNAVTLPALIAQREFRAADVGTVVALVVAI